MSIDLTGLVIRTARYSYRGPLRWDITRKGNVAPWNAFAPSDQLLRTALAARAEADALLKAAAGEGLGDGRDDERRRGMLADAEEIECRAWETYAIGFMAEMRLCAGMVSTSSRWDAAHHAAWQRGAGPRPDVWQELAGIVALKQGSLHPPDELDGVLVCFCGSPWADAPLRHCHRFLVADVLVKLGARYEGEIDLPARRAA